MVGAQGQAKWAKVAQKSSTYDVTHKKPAPPGKNFLQVQARRLAASFDASIRSVTLTGAEIFLRKATCVLVFFSENLRKQPDTSVLKKCSSNFNNVCVVCSVSVK